MEFQSSSWLPSKRWKDQAAAIYTAHSCPQDWAGRSGVVAPNECSQCGALAHGMAVFGTCMGEEIHTRKVVALVRRSSGKTKSNILV